VYYIVYKKLLFYLKIRNCFLALSKHKRFEFATTILITDILDKNLHILRELYSIFSKEIRSIKINQDIFALSKKILRRQKLICAYKIAIIKNIKLAIYSCSRQYTNNYSSSRNIAIIEKLLFDNVLLDSIRIESRRS